MNNSPSIFFLIIAFVKEISPDLSDGFKHSRHEWVKCYSALRSFKHRMSTHMGINPFVCKLFWSCSRDTVWIYDTLDNNLGIEN